MFQKESKWRELKVIDEFGEASLWRQEMINCPFQRDVAVLGDWKRKNDRCGEPGPGLEELLPKAASTTILAIV